MNIKELLTAARENISQEELADQIGIENKKISKWEMEDFNPNLHELKILSVFFERSISQIVNDPYLNNKKSEIGEILEDEIDFKYIVFMSLLLIEAVIFNMNIVSIKNNIIFSIIIFIVGTIFFIGYIFTYMLDMVCEILIEVEE